MNEKHQRFVQHLWGLNRQAFAELRRSLSDEPGLHMKAIPYVERFTLNENAWNRKMYYLLAGLFCLTERPLEGKEARAPQPLERNLGDSIGSLYVARDKSPSIEKRLVALLDADEERLPDRLRQMVTLLNAHQIAIGWEVLLTDLCYWNAEKRTVQHRWARAFYVHEDKNNPSTPQSTADSETVLPSGGQ